MAGQSAFAIGDEEQGMALDSRFLIDNHDEGPSTQEPSKSRYESSSPNEQNVVMKNDNSEEEKESKTDGPLTGRVYLYSRYCTKVKEYKAVNDASYAKPIEVVPSSEKADYSEIMRQRWVKVNRYLPNIDKDDISRSEPLVNGNLIIPLDNLHQHNAEYTQSSYLRIRYQEESLPMYNYFDTRQNPDWLSFLDELDQTIAEESSDLEVCQSRKQATIVHIISKQDRGYAVQKIFLLHQKKGYRNETLFTAINILDRYLATIGHWNLPREQVCLLATTSLLLAAKMEEKYAPNFECMIKYLTKEEQENVSVNALLDLEGEILVLFGFDLRFPGPMAPLERYLRVLNFDDKKLVRVLAFQIGKFSTNDTSFLKYRPSIIAACALIISINIYKRDQEKYQKSGVFSQSNIAMADPSSFFDLSHRSDRKGDPLIAMQTSIWNDEEVAVVTGYSIDMLKHCLYELSMFIKQNLSPDRLVGFDIESIRKINSIDQKSEQ